LDVFVVLFFAAMLHTSFLIGIWPKHEPCPARKPVVEMWCRCESPQGRDLGHSDAPDTWPAPVARRLLIAVV
jgi:hypothetical protein